MSAGKGSDKTSFVVDEAILTSLRNRQESNAGHAAIDDPVSISCFDLSRVLQGLSRRNVKALSGELTRERRGRHRAADPGDALFDGCHREPPFLIEVRGAKPAQHFLFLNRVVRQGCRRGS
jgi:hypothetical protein